MPYTEQDLKEIERDPEKLRRYYAHMIMHWRRLALQYRRESRRMGEIHPVQNYRDVFDDGLDLVRWSNTLESMADFVSQNIDAFVETTLTKGKETKG